MERKNDVRNYSVKFSELKDTDFQFKRFHHRSKTINEMNYIKAQCYILDHQRYSENPKNFPI